MHVNICMAQAKDGVGHAWEQMTFLDALPHGLDMGCHTYSERVTACMQTQLRCELYRTAVIGPRHTSGILCFRMPAT